MRPYQTRQGKNIENRTCLLIRWPFDIWQVKKLRRLTKGACSR